MGAIKSPLEIRTDAERSLPKETDRASTPALEKYYSPKEISQLMDLSTDTIRRMFLREPGVLIINDGTHGKRRYRTLRIPESVVQRVLRRLTLTRVI